jgi:hypothetical protein
MIMGWGTREKLEEDREMEGTNTFEIELLDDCVEKPCHIWAGHIGLAKGSQDDNWKGRTARPTDETAQENEKQLKSVRLTRYGRSGSTRGKLELPENAR